MALKSIWRGTEFLFGTGDASSLLNPVCAGSTLLDGLSFKNDMFTLELELNASCWLMVSKVHIYSGSLLRELFDKIMLLLGLRTVIFSVCCGLAVKKISMHASSTKGGT